MTASSPHRVAVVTGGSRGIGRAVAAQLAGDGFDLLLTAQSAANLQGTADALGDLGRRIVLCPVDLRVAGAAEQIRDTVSAAFGRVDALVNCAGATKGGVFLDTPDSLWEDGFALKFYGAVRMCRAFWPMLRQAHGSVVNIVGGFARTPDPDFLIGGAVNAALANFTKGLSKLGIRDDVTVNAIHPGTVVTERVRDIARTRAEIEGASAEAVLASMVDRERIRRLGQPEDVARLVGFLCGPHARHIQGTAIAVDGGATQSLF